MNIIARLFKLFFINSHSFNEILCGTLSNFFTHRGVFVNVSSCAKRDFHYWKCSIGCNQLFMSFCLWIVKSSELRSRVVILLLCSILHTRAWNTATYLSMKHRRVIGSPNNYLWDDVGWQKKGPAQNQPLKFLTFEPESSRSQSDAINIGNQY